jgi:hypothetical protein
MLKLTPSLVCIGTCAVDIPAKDTPSSSATESRSRPTLSSTDVTNVEIPQMDDEQRAVGLTLGLGLHWDSPSADQHMVIIGTVV